ncbi:MAG: ABC transporter permease [Ardenticatenales bacterium]|nr:ABC transporter permease [Ardenticatenales bacterium]
MPLLAAFFPTRQGTQVTVQEAISDYGVDGNAYGDSWLERGLQKLHFLSQPLQIGLRNTFRNKSRLLLTLVALTAASGISVSVLSTLTGLTATLDKSDTFFQDDISFSFSRGYPIEEILQAVEGVKGVVRIEAWILATLRLRLADGSESRDITVWAAPPDTQMLQPLLMEGRWLQPGDTNAVVINPYLYSLRSDVRVGDELTFIIQGRALPFEVVGLIESIPNGLNPSPYVYVPYDYYATEAGEVGLANRAQVLLTEHDAATQTSFAADLERRFKQGGISLDYVITGADLRRAFESSLNIGILLLLVMALLMSIVGGLGLAGAMILNVLERTREIGVLRALGASDGAVLQIVLVEGLLVGLISWLLGAILAVPLSAALSSILGNAFIRIPLDYSYPIGGLFAWLAVIVVIVLVASYAPARHASRLTIREVLSYE